MHGCMAVACMGAWRLHAWVHGSCKQTVARLEHPHNNHGCGHYVVQCDGSILAALNGRELVELAQPPLHPR